MAWISVLAKGMESVIKKIMHSDGVMGIWCFGP